MDSRIQQLQDKLERLTHLQSKLGEELGALKKELDLLKSESVSPEHKVQSIIQPEALPILNVLESPPLSEPPKSKLSEPVPEPPPLFYPKPKTDWEKYIGENLSSKIGIAILVLGVGIGTKYAIDHNILSPLVRVILGYLLGFALTFSAYWFKEKYKGFSAVLLGGSMAIHYFLTYFAYSLYGFIGQVPAFAIMAGFTVFTSIAAVQYNRQAIAHIGLIGAYGVPFLLSDGSGRVAILFAYMVLVNMGVVAVVARKDWRYLFVHSLVLSWIIFASWSLFDFNYSNQSGIHLLFSGLFFVQFYTAIYLHKAKSSGDERTGILHLVLTLVNAVFFFLLNYHLLDSKPGWQVYTGLFTAGNAAIHLLVVAFMQKQSTRQTAYFNAVLGLVFVFLSLAIPVQLDGEWVTLAWGLEALILFWVARKHHLRFYEITATCLMAISLGSLLQDWGSQLRLSTSSQQTMIPVFNLRFLGNGLMVLLYAAMLRISLKHAWVKDNLQTYEWKKLRTFLLPALFVLSLLGLGMVEISVFWNQKFFILAQKYAEDAAGFDLSPVHSFKHIWQVNYLLGISCALLATQLWRESNEDSADVYFTGMLLLSMALYLIVSLPAFMELRQVLSLSAMPGAPIALKGSSSIRYVSLVFMLPALFLLYKAFPVFARFGSYWKMLGVLAFHFVFLAMISSELLALLPDTYNSRQLVLSLVWGVYALFLVVKGIRNGISFLRIAAIVLFAITLVKVLLIDLRHLDTLSKTLVLVGLGLLLLVISFLYNRYKKSLDEEMEKE